jgi:hypothetical protein
VPDNATVHYHRAEIQAVLDAGPHPDETWFRLQVSGAEKSKHLNISPDQLVAIRDILAPTNDSEVWVLVFEHGHGTDASVHATEASARHWLFGYVTEWWSNELDGDAMPADPETAITAYFDRVAESYTLAPASVQRATNEEG